MIYHVSVHGNDRAKGSEQAPFRTINHAAKIASPGDTVKVHGGVYREWVDPKNGGLNDQMRITYEAAEGEHPVIKGSESVTGWVPIKGTVWKKELPNAFFGEWNPYEEKIEGDWLLEPKDHKAHCGEVYLNGKSFYEASSMEDLFRAEVRTVYCQNTWRLRDERILHPEDTVYRWFAEVNADTTVIYANFQDHDPNRETVEINVRKCCFFPRELGVNYITVRGFEMAHAATPWNPPTAEQIGMVGPHWAKGWIIENNDLHDAKTSAISIGKEAATGQNLGTRFGRKSGHRYQAEAVFTALRTGWSREKIGSHLIRNNCIHDCGENGIVGHMGCVFSRIEHNHIYNIGVKHEFFGHEMAGIKLHAAVDVVIENNNVHHCTLGTWLDWQAQGARVTRNLYHENDRDLMIEVTHGPCLVDNNVLLSDYALDNHAQGTAFVHNLIAGLVWLQSVRLRATPYHFPHSTEVAGYAPVYGGDDRVFNNLFLGIAEDAEVNGTLRYRNLSANYDAFPTPEEYWKKIRESGIPLHDHRLHTDTPQPVWIADNAYSGHASPYCREEGALRADGMNAVLQEKDGAWFLTLTVPEAIADADASPVTTERLGAPRLTEELYENPDGTPVDLSGDLIGEKRGNRLTRGPLSVLRAGTQTVKVWQ